LYCPTEWKWGRNGEINTTKNPQNNQSSLQELETYSVLDFCLTVELVGITGTAAHVLLLLLLHMDLMHVGPTVMQRKCRDD
jgi:hypothetical protein